MRVAILAAFAALLAAPAMAQPNPLPPGDGRDVVASACTQCHGPGVFTQLRVGAEAWRHQVYDMVLRGAQVSPGEVDQVVTYLATNFGPGINVPPPASAVKLPDGSGKTVVEAQCGVCHGLDRAVSTARAPAEWDAIVRRMTLLGAPLSSEEAKTVTAYLTQNFGAK